MFNIPCSTFRVLGLRGYWFKSSETSFLTSCLLPLTFLPLISRTPTSDIESFVSWSLSGRATSGSESSYLISYHLPLTSYLLPLTSYLLPLTSCLLPLTSFSRTPTSDLYSKLFVVGERDTKTFYSSTGKRSKVLRTFWILFRRFEVFIRDMEIARPKKAHRTAKKKSQGPRAKTKECRTRNLSNGVLDIPVYRNFTPSHSFPIFHSSFLIPHSLIFSRTPTFDIESFTGWSTSGRATSGWMSPSHLVLIAESLNLRCGRATKG
jgi:hypothetical protein